MPVISVTANLQNITPAPSVALRYDWAVTLIFHGQGCPHSLGRMVKHPDIRQFTTTNKFRIPFSAVRGGVLTVSVKVQAANQVLTATSQGLSITGTNPSVAVLAAFVDPDAGFRKLMRVESRLRQFLSPNWPYFSEDNRGGVGICQVTDSPSDDAVWSWKENVKAGWAIYEDKQQHASSYPKTVRNGSRFKTLVQQYNDLRYAKAKQTPKAAAAAVPSTTSAPPKEVPRKDLSIILPDFTAEQLQLDTIRGYNGYADGLHEFRVRLDDNGVLYVNVDEPNLKGTAEWERVTAQMRKAQYDADNLPSKNRGDINYVDDVVAQPGF
jgi:hypothetical protein